MSGKDETHEEHSVEIMYIAVFPTTVVDVILWHSDLRSIENRRLQQRKFLRTQTQRKTKKSQPHSYRSRYEYPSCS